MVTVWVQVLVLFQDVPDADAPDAEKVRPCPDEDEEGGVEEGTMNDADALGLIPTRMEDQLWA